MSEDNLEPLLRPPVRRPSGWRRFLLFAAALLAAVGAVVGSLLPVMPGIPFFVAGLLMVSVASDRGRKLINRAEQRLPLRVRIAIRKGLRTVPSRRLRSILAHETPKG